MHVVILSSLILGVGIAFLVFPYSRVKPNDFINTLGIEMVWCEPGTFRMGTPEGESAWDTFETPHQVTLSGFWVARFEINQDEWKALMPSNPSQFQVREILWGWMKVPCNRHPVDNVTWDEALEFCGKLNERERKRGRLPEGWEYTLPTEAQWEYACRAGTTTAYSFGDVLEKRQANFEFSGDGDGQYLVSPTFPGGTFPPNGWGICDMHGSLWEWCLDGYEDFEDYPHFAVTDPLIQKSGKQRILRGGAWSGGTENCRSGIRGLNSPSSGNGFRPVLTQIR